MSRLVAPPAMSTMTQATGDLKVDAGGNVGTSGTVVANVANLGTGLANETIKILFDDGGTGGSDVV